MSTDCDWGKVGKEAWRVPVIKMQNCIRFVCEYINVYHIHTQTHTLIQKEREKERDVKHFFL